MSRSFLIGLLVLFVGLLGVMTYVVRRSTEPPKPSAEETARAQKAQQQQQQQQQREMSERMKQMAKQQKALAVKQAAAAAEANRLGKQAPKQNTGSISIEGKWDLKRPEGEAGIVQLQKEDAANKPAPPPGSASSMPMSATAPAPGKPGLEKPLPPAPQ